MKYTLKCIIDGQEVSEAEFNRRRRSNKTLGGKTGPVSKAYNRPLKSVGASVPKHQAKEFNQLYAAHGISGANHDANGNLRFDSREARRKVCKLSGIRDNDAGFGDYAGK